MEFIAKTLGTQVSRLVAHRTLVVPSVNLSRTYAATAQQVPEQQQQQANSRTELDYEELSDLLTFNSDLALIDVRNPQEIDTYGSIPGSINIPLSDVKTALQLSDHDFQNLFLLRKPSKGKNLVFFARGPNASSAAVEIAHRLGFKGSRQYSGGWEDYCNKTGLPLKKNLPKTIQEQRAPFIGHTSYSVYNTYTI